MLYQMLQNLSNQTSNTTGADFAAARNDKNRHSGLAMIDATHLPGTEGHRGSFINWSKNSRNSRSQGYENEDQSTCTSTQKIKTIHKL
jgi:hypothetical protein